MTEWGYLSSLLLGEDDDSLMVRYHQIYKFASMNNMFLHVQPVDKNNEIYQKIKDNSITKKSSSKGSITIKLAEPLFP